MSTTTAQNNTQYQEESYERKRIPVSKTVGGDHFAALYSAEHVAGGEFVVGVAFASWGASPAQVIIGLIIGNLLAVLSWALVCSPVATRSRITLYYYLERLAGKRLTHYYNILNGIIFAVIAGGMVTISASAFNALTGGTPQVNWYPTSPIFVIIALAISAVMVLLTLRGFDSLSKVSKLCAPWLMTIFVVSGLASLPYLMHAGAGLSFGELFSNFVWTGKTPDGSPSFSIWQIAAFAWGLNLPLHLGMGDLSTLRFANNKNHGYYSAFAAYGGHFMAWIACGILGATTALILNTPITSLDVGGVVAPILGISGTAAVVVASLTTAIPSFYRACLAFTSILPKLSYARVAVVFGVIIAIVACFPLIFLKWLDIMAYFNIALAPIGAIIFVEHFILPRAGIRPFWRELTKEQKNRSALIVWIAGIALAATIVLLKLTHLFFVFIWVYIFCAIVYMILAKKEAKSVQNNQTSTELYSNAYGDDEPVINPNSPSIVNELPNYKHPLFALAILSLMVMVVSCLGGFIMDDPAIYRQTLQWILAGCSALYFVCMLLWSKVGAK